MIKVKVTIARTENGKYVAYTMNEPFFMFEHEDLKALAQIVDNTLRSFEEFHDQSGIHYEPNYYFKSEILRLDTVFR